jgi:uncharacterized membrane protein YfcA
VPTALLLVGGFVVGIFSVIVGGGFFVSIPFLQFLFPSVSYGAIVGNLKVGSFFRGIGSTITNRKEIDWLGNLLWSVPLVIGTVLGVMVIGNWTSAGCSRPSSRLSRSPSSLPG